MNNEFRIPDNASVRVMPSDDGGVAILVRMPGQTIALLAGIDVALDLSEEINRVAVNVSIGCRHE